MREHYPLLRNIDKHTESINTLLSTRYDSRYLENCILESLWNGICTALTEGKPLPILKEVIYGDLYLLVEDIVIENGETRTLLAGEICDITLSESIYVALAQKGFIKLELSRPEVVIPRFNVDESLSTYKKMFGKVAGRANKWRGFTASVIFPCPSYYYSEDVLPDRNNLLDLYWGNFVHHTEKYLIKNYVEGVSGEICLNVLEDRVELTYYAKVFTFFKHGDVYSIICPYSTLLQVYSSECESLAYIHLRGRGSDIYWVNSYFRRTSKNIKNGLGSYCIYIAYSSVKSKFGFLNMGFAGQEYKLRDYKLALTKMGIAPNKWN
jgi:hypothetical protein